MIELLIVMAVLGILAVGVLAAVDPFEQLKKGRDSIKRDISMSVYTGVIRLYAANSGLPWKENYVATQLSSSDGNKITDTLVQNGELKTDFNKATGGLSSVIYATVLMNGPVVTVCYLPESKTGKNNDARYDNTGAKVSDCSNVECYACIGVTEAANNSAVPGNAGSPSPTVSITPGPTADVCSGFNPEYPQYAYTCNTSSKWSVYGCTNYCVADMGCAGGNGCPAGQRRLVKNYFAASGEAFKTCLSQQSITSESYCVSGSVGACATKNYYTSDLDYNWGCTNPRRPMGWK